MKANTATLGTYTVAGAGIERATNAALICAAPFIGLAYVIALPVIGLGALAWLGLKALAARWKTAARAVRNVALFFAAPFVGLAYAVAFPFVGAGMLVWWAARGATRRHAAC